VTRAVKIVVVSLAAVLSLLLLLLAVAAFLLSSESGSRWVLARVPGLQVEQFQGSLASRWQASRVIWDSAGTRAELDSVALAWRPACLLRRTLCVERLHAGNISLTLPPATADSADQAPPSLPDIELPLALELGDVQVGSLLLDGSEQLRELKLAAHWQGDGLQIDSAHLRHGDLVLDLTGRLQPTGQWPLEARAQLQLPEVAGQPWQLTLALQGNLLDKLALDGQSTGYLPAELSGELQPLQEHLPARLRITSAAFKAAADLPETLTLQQLVLSAEGDLQAGYRLDGQASLPAEKGPVALVLRGKADAKGATIDALDLDASPSQHLGLSAQLDWQQGFAAKGRIAWRDFPWHNLYPAIAAPQFTLRSLDGEVDYRDGNYLGNLRADLDGPAGKFNLSTPFSGNLEQVFLPQLELKAGTGSASGHLTLGFADGIRWQTALTLSAIDPAYWLAELPGTLAGPVTSSGSLRNGQLALDAAVDVKGRLRGQPAVFQATAKGADQRWLLERLDLRLGDNRVSGSGRLDQRLSATLDLDLPRLTQLWPSLQGQLKGQVMAAGSLEAPQGQVSLQGQGLALESNRLQSLRLKAVVDNRQQATLDLAASNLRAGDTALGDLTASGRGDLRKQAVQLGLQGPLLKLALALDGGLAQGDWRGRLASADIQAGGQDWRLQAPAKLERLADGTVNLGAHCWRSGPASLCGQDQRLAPEPRLRFQLKEFPLQSLGQWLPPNLAWQGRLDADLQLDLPAAGPKGRIVIDASGGTLRIRDQRQWLDFPYRALKLTSQLSPRQVDTHLQFEGGRLGTLRLNTRLDPLAADKPLSGDFDLSGLDLSIAQPLVTQVDKLTGRLEGNGRISGSLLAPQINGVVTLHEGEVSGGQLPLPIQNLSVTAAIKGEDVQLDGAWKSGDSGQGTLKGQLGWANGLAVEVQLQGSRLPITVEPYAVLEAAPDLRIHLQDNRLAISGKVAVPNGNITVRQLPPSTVKLSDDAVIVGQQAPDGMPLAMAMDIDVVVGAGKLAFSGFGLTANLAGHVHVGDNLDTRGELSLNDGRYRAYGQRLTIRRARLLFAGPIDQPYLDIEAVRQTDEVIAGIRLSGPAEQPSSEVFSEPSMSQEEALSYLVLGRPLSTTGEDNNMLAQAALALGLAGSSSTAGKLANNLGIKDFQLDTQGSGTTTSVVASGNLTDKLILRYGVGVFEPANTIALRYLLSKKVYVEAASGVASSLDIFYKRDF
jgi:translocation and assembly module TamB